MEAIVGTAAGEVARGERAGFSSFLSNAAASPPHAHHTPDDLRWALSIVQSRALRVFKTRAQDHALHDTPFLAPGADLMNHQPAAQVGWRVGNAADGGALDISTHTAYPRAGMEVFNQYAVS